MIFLLACSFAAFIVALGWVIVFRRPKSAVTLAMPFVSAGAPLFLHKLYLRTGPIDVNPAIALGVVVLVLALFFATILRRAH